jgi:uncharacterized protein YcbK (DUF882 family)
MKLTSNFNKSEFDSKDGAEMPKEVLANVKKLAKALQVIRNNTGKKITINSGYRSPSHNKSIGGASKSQHLLGNASDIVVEDHTPKQVYELIELLIEKGELPEGGLKAYSNFTHYDIRGKKARW